MKTAAILRALTGVLMLLFGAVQAGAQAVTIFAAASLQGPLDDIAAASGRPSGPGEWRRFSSPE
ncbi:MAG: hypothetical protein AAGL98_06405, partial [Planctomycetota bacterium]